jgi:hypothetical protein
MTEQEMQALIQEGKAIDAGEAAHAEAAATGQLDMSGKIIAPDADAAAMEWMFIGEILGFVSKAIMPETAEYYTDAQSMTLARAFVPVAEKYGWSGNQMAPELGLAMAAFGFAMPAVMAYRERKALAVKKAEEGGDGR